ncbi:hypothetical protein ACFL1F_00055 [Chlamydiota bacterium]
MKKIKHNTILYYTEDALLEINKIISGCKNNSLDEGEYFVLMEHAIEMFNFAFNARYLSRKEASELSQEEYEKCTLPPREIFERIRRKRGKMI